MTPWLDDGDVRLFHGDALEVLQGLPDGSVHMCATSPPFYGLRDYGVAGQVGLEATPDEWVARLVAVFREVRRVLRDDGTLWVEIGSSYVSSDLSRQRDRAPAYDSGGKESQDSPDPGFACLDPDDERSGETRSHRRNTEHTAQPRELDAQPDAQKARGIAPGDCEEASSAAAAPDAPASTTLASSRRSHLQQPTEPFDPITPHSSQPDDPQSEDREACISDTSQPASEHHNQGRDASGTAWIEYTRSLKPKDLLPQPWLLAMALQMDGWYLRSEIVWFRPNPMPESVTDRPTKAHSTVFLLSKRPRYFFDADAIRQPFYESTMQRGYTASKADNGRGRKAEANAARNDAGEGWTPPFDRPVPQAETLDGSAGEAPRGPDGRRQTTVQKGDNSEQHRDGERWPNPTGANARSVWTIPTEPTPFAHFATWPQALVRRMILAGTSERGACPECGAPWVREVEQEFVKTRGDHHPNTRNDPAMMDAGSIIDSRTTGHRLGYGRYDVTTTGWSPSCLCAISDDYVGPDEPSALGPHTPVPCTVLDPFAGSGTTSLVARNHGRHSIGIELNEQYLTIAAKRLQQLSLLAAGRPGTGET